MVNKVEYLGGCQLPRVQGKSRPCRFKLPSGCISSRVHARYVFTRNNGRQ